MAIDHRRTAGVRHVGPQLRLLGLRGHRGDERVLGSRNAGGKGTDGHADDEDRNDEVPDQPMVRPLERRGGPTIAQHRRRAVWKHERKAEGVGAVERREEETGQDRRLKERAHGQHRRLTQIGERVRTAEILRPFLLRRRIEIPGERPEQDDHDRGRDDLPERTRGRNHAG